MKAATPETAVLIASLPPTRFDLRFRWFGVPTRVHPLFWLIMLLLWPGTFKSAFALEDLAMWILAAFISILMHEWGHVLAYRFYRCSGTHITLESFGGLAHADNAPNTSYRRIAVSLAGPGMQFLICIALGIGRGVEPNWPLGVAFPYVALFESYLMGVSFFWAMFNLLPVFPLDGGMVCREVCYILKLPKPLVMSLKISFGTAIGLLAIFVIAMVQPSLVNWIPSWFPLLNGLLCVLMMASLAVTSYQALKAVQHNPWGHGEDEVEWWQRG